MKKTLFLAILPFVLFALEKVNLIKDAGFEKNSDMWNAYVDNDSAIVSHYDPEKAFRGSYAASCDTRKETVGTGTDRDLATVIRGFSYPKVVGDIDSLVWSYSILPVRGSINYAYGAVIGIYLDTSATNRWKVGYALSAPDLGPLNPTPPELYLEVISFSDDTAWHTISRGIGVDLDNRGIPSDVTIDSFVLRGFGFYSAFWRGQKIYWDAIRLTGYADYDVGLKEILSGESLEKDTPYTPFARIKNFGRENAPEFSVIAEIFEGTTRVYYDSLPWSLTSDTEDTVSFAAFTPTSSANHTLVVRTSMEPDESDEDDEMTKTLFGTGIEEPVTQPSSLQLDIAALSSIRYSIPSDEQGNLTLYDPTGRRIESLKVQGTGEARFKVGLASGVYFVKLETKHSTLTKKAVILR